MYKKSTLLFLLFLSVTFLIALLLRSYRVLHYPPSLFIDEYNLGLPALEIINGSSTLPWYGIGWYGVPMVHIYYIAGVLLALGRNEWALRMAWVIPATLTIPIVVYVLKQMGNYRIAILTAIFLTFSPVHVHLSRWAHGAVITPCIFFASITTYTLLRSTSRVTQKILLSIFCGLLLAGMVYTYLGGRVLYAVFWVYVVADLSVGKYIHSKTHKDKHIPFFLYPVIICVISLIILAPFLIYGYFHTIEFWGRAGEASILNISLPLQSNLQALFRNIVLYGGMFWDEPDPNGRHTLFVGKPIFGYWFSALFVLGVMMYTFKRKLRALPILLLFFGTLVGGILSVEAPSIFRTAAVIPFVYGFGAYALDKLYKIWKYLGLILLLLTFSFLGRDMLRATNIITKPTPDYYSAFSYRESAIARTAYAYAQKGFSVYLSPDFFYYSSVRFVYEQGHQNSLKPYTLFNVGDEQIINEPNTVLIVDAPFISLKKYYSILWPRVKMSVRNEHGMHPFIIIEPNLNLNKKTPEGASNIGLAQTWYTNETKSTRILSKTVPSLYNSWPADYPRQDATYAEWVGTLTVPHTDMYTFYGHADDLGGMVIYKPTDSTGELILLSIPMQETFRSSVTLEKDMPYRLKMMYRNTGGAQKYILTVKSTYSDYGILDPLWLKPLGQ